MYVWMFVREGEKTWSTATWLQQGSSSSRSKVILVAEATIVLGFGFK
jgi:hypothetical protein